MNRIVSTGDEGQANTVAEEAEDGEAIHITRKWKFRLLISILRQQTPSSTNKI